ncbi:hypothetical protein PENTCL1PPCAC_22289, partial [Pristionchus entomophagus]
SDCAVHFKNSLILDEFDLSGQDSVSLDSVCRDNGCKVYVSSVKDATLIDKLTFKPATGDEISLKSFTDNFDAKTRQKIPYVVKKGDSVSIKNANDNFACGPIVIYAIRNGAPNSDIAGVYDVSTTYRDEQALGKVVTVMGPTPFTVWASSPSENLEASVFATGFDIEEGEKCTEVYHSNRGLGIKYAINGPITTLFFKEEVQMNVDFLDFFESKLNLTAATLFTSQGYIGCGNAEIYHSSLYDSQINFELSSDIPRTTHLEAFLNTDDPLTLRLDGNAEMERNFTGSIGDDSYSRTGDISARELSFTYSMADDASFLVKFTDLGITPEVTTRRTPPTSSTSLRPTSPTLPTSPSPTTTTSPSTTSAARG